MGGGDKLMKKVSPIIQCSMVQVTFMKLHYTYPQYDVMYSKLN